MTDDTLTDGRDIGFYVVQNDFLTLGYAAKVGTTATAVYNALALFAFGKDAAWPKHQTIADMLGISRKSVITALAELEAANIISVKNRFRQDGGGKTSNIYRLNDRREWGEKLSTGKSEKTGLTAKKETDVKNLHIAQNAGIGGSDVKILHIEEYQVDNIPIDSEPSYPQVDFTAEIWQRACYELRLQMTKATADNLLTGTKLTETRGEYTLTAPGRAVLWLRRLEPRLIDALQQAALQQAGAKVQSLVIREAAQ